MAKMKYLDESTTKEIIKKYGDVVRSGSEVFEERSNFQVIPVSPALDIALGGCFLEGSWATFMGDPKSGKTTTAGKLAKWIKNKKNKKVLLASLDTYRPAAKEQLKLQVIHK